VYDPDTDAMSIWAATSGEGQVPTGCPLIALYHDAIYLGGHEKAPHAWYKSKTGDALDWDYTDTTSLRAIQGSVSDAGLVGDTLTALIPFSDDYMLMCGSNSVWVLRGDPAFDGVVLSIAKNVGAIDKGAWCFGPAGEVYILANTGLYRIAPDPMGHTPPEPLSRPKLPRELQRVDVTSNTVLLTWNDREQGVNIFVTPDDSNESTNWFYDVRLKSFWKDTLSAEHSPTALLCYNAANVEQQKMLLGGRDGYVRAFDPAAPSDDGTAIDSYAVYSPQTLAGNMHEDGVLETLDAVLAEDSDDVDWEVRVGETHEEAVGASAFTSGTWTETGRQYTERPQARGSAVTLKLSNDTADESWAVENIVGTATKRGVRTKL
jgi:hypothetical protein